MLRRPREAKKLIKSCRMLLRQLDGIPDELREKEPSCHFCSEDLKRWYGGPVSRAIRDLQIAENPFSWLFSSETQKQRAFSACNYLFDVLTLGLGPACRELRMASKEEGQIHTEEK